MKGRGGDVSIGARECIRTDAKSTLDRGSLLCRGGAQCGVGARTLSPCAKITTGSRFCGPPEAAGPHQMVAMKYGSGILRQRGRGGAVEREERFATGPGSKGRWRGINLRTRGLMRAQGGPASGPQPAGRSNPAVLPPPRPRSTGANCWRRRRRCCSARPFRSRRRRRSPGRRRSPAEEARWT